MHQHAWQFCCCFGFFSLLKFKNPCKASKSKHIFNDSYHYYFTIKLFDVGLSCIICESTDVQVTPVKDLQKTWQLMEIQILEKGQKQPHYQPVIWACSPKRCYQPWNGSCWEKQDQSNPFCGFCVYHAFKLRLRPRVVMETAAAGGEGKKKVRLLLNLVGCMGIMRVIIMWEIGSTSTREAGASFVCSKARSPEGMLGGDCESSCPHMKTQENARLRRQSRVCHRCRDLAESLQSNKIEF